MGRKNCFPTIKHSHYFFISRSSCSLDDHDRQGKDAHRQQWFSPLLHFLKCVRAELFEILLKKKNTTSGIISKWNDFNPRHFLSLQISALGPSFQQAGRQECWNITVKGKECLGHCWWCPVCAAVLSQVRMCWGIGLRSTGAIPGNS